MRPQGPAAGTTMRFVAGRRHSPGRRGPVLRTCSPEQGRRSRVWRGYTNGTCFGPTGRSRERVRAPCAPGLALHADRRSPARDAAAEVGVRTQSLGAGGAGPRAPARPHGRPCVLCRPRREPVNSGGSRGARGRGGGAGSSAVSGRPPSLRPAAPRRAGRGSPRWAPGAAPAPVLVPRPQEVPGAAGLQASPLERAVLELGLHRYAKCPRHPCES